MFKEVKHRKLLLPKIDFESIILKCKKCLNVKKTCITTKKYVFHPIY